MFSEQSKFYLFRRKVVKLCLLHKYLFVLWNKHNFERTEIVPTFISNTTLISREDDLRACSNLSFTISCSTIQQNKTKLSLFDRCKTRASRCSIHTMAFIFRILIQYMAKIHNPDPPCTFPPMNPALGYVHSPSNNIPSCKDHPPISRVPKKKVKPLQKQNKRDNQTWRRQLTDCSKQQ